MNPETDSWIDPTLSIEEQTRTAALREQLAQSKVQEFVWAESSDSYANECSELKSALAQAQDALKAKDAALLEITERQGPFSCDQLQHAENVIEAMQELARAALATKPASAH